jgi:ribosomal protein S3AE
MASDRKSSKLKKKWYKIIAPSEFNEILIGETLSYDPRLLIGKVVTANLANLTRDIKKQNIIMAFKVSGLKENNALTEPVSYKMVPTFIKRIIRRGRENIHDSFLCSTADEKKVRIKPLVITVNKTKGIVIKSLIKNMRDSLKEYVRKLTYKELVNELVSHKLQGTLKKKLTKIYPLRSFEIKEMKIETGKKTGQEETKKVKEKPKEYKTDKKEEKKQEKPEDKNEKVADKKEEKPKKQDKENNSDKNNKEKK